MMLHLIITHFRINHYLYSFIYHHHMCVLRLCIDTILVIHEDDADSVNDELWRYDCLVCTLFNLFWWMMISAGKQQHCGIRTHSEIDKKTVQMKTVYGFIEYTICKLLTIRMREYAVCLWPWERFIIGFFEWKRIESQFNFCWRISIAFHLQTNYLSHFHCVRE